MGVLIDNQADICRLYEQTLCTKTVANKYKVHRNSIIKFLKKLGYKFTNRKYTLNEKFFDTIDNQYKAYVLGLIWADGTIDDYSLRISLSDKYGDDSLLYKIADILGSNRPLYTRDNMVTLDVSSKYMINSLKEYGLHRNKTYTALPPLNVMDIWFPHFIRGYFDGDGCINRGRPKLTHSLKYRVCFTRTNEMMQWINNIIRLNCDCQFSIRERWPDRNNNNVDMQVGGNLQCLRVLQFLYKNSNIHLIRKYNKYQNLEAEYVHCNL